ncbi:ImmA/IrrE family metallo-endopeptidase [Pedobacter paludis]|uniref:IrrE N-terminal-like domain-containing protein n=1 Tax=Pedobacter paludis TaxID=2203212 RepID=A0A317F2B2_9SPHI|nr:ImmA/IrrE family metallo-endopeptidase [Pedobacter paludis]PWS33370.1 hypothetical protein DF947_01720 [Pedobacter paludis]
MMRNTTLKGDKFEDQCHQVISKAALAGQFGFQAESCRIFRKKKYYSVTREKDIIFDLSIELWLPGASDYSLLVIMECKDLGRPVSVDDVEEFDSKVRQVSGLNVKAVFMSKTRLQSGAETYLKNRKIMWIQVDQSGVGKIKLNMPRRRKDKSYDAPVAEIQQDIQQIKQIQSFISSSAQASTVDLDALMTLFLKDVFCNNLPASYDDGVFGLERLSANLIESLTRKILFDFDPILLSRYQAFPIKAFRRYLKDRFGVAVIEELSLKLENGQDRSGYYDPATKTIYIDRELVGSERYAFVFAHEAGHFFLHDKLKMSQTVYDETEDSPYNPSTGKHDLLNEKHWIEWQANKFAACILMPQESVMYKLLSYQYEHGIRNKGKIIYDNQSCNIRDFQVYLLILSEYFGVSYLQMEYRLSDLNILIYARGHSGNAYRYSGKSRRVRTVGEIFTRLNFFLYPNPKGTR